MLRSQNVRDDDVVEKAGDGLARVSRVGRVRIAALALFLSRASILTGHRDGLCARRCASFRHPLREFGFKIRDDKKK
jgi:hypothetical protein